MREREGRKREREPEREVWEGGKEIQGESPETASARGRHFIQIKAGQESLGSEGGT